MKSCKDNRHRPVTVSVFSPEMLPCLEMELGTSSHPLILYKGIIHPVDENPDHISGKQTDDPLPEFQIILFRLSAVSVWGSINYIT